MKKLTNEEILADCVCLANIDEIHHQSILSAMSEAVKQRDEEIKEWIEKFAFKRVNVIDYNDFKQFLNQ